MSTISISVVILTCNQRDLTLRCLRSLSRFIECAEHEVILVDNGSTDGTGEAVSKAFPAVRILALPENRGVAAGRNAGLAIANGDYLMILDNDTIADAETITALADFLRRHPEVGIVAPRLIAPDGSVQNSFKKFPGIGQKILNIIGGRKRNIAAGNIPVKAMEPFYLIGAAQMFTRLVYQMAGPLDERIFFGPEDADFCMSVRSLWKKVVYYPALTIIHDWQRSSSRKPFSPQARKHAAALLYFYAKHKRFF